MGARPTRLHLALQLVERGHAADVDDAFKRWLKRGQPAAVTAQWPVMEAAAEGRSRNAGADHGRMTSELRDLRGKNAALQAEARNVAARLDSVIERLKVVAEG